MQTEAVGSVTTEVGASATLVGVLPTKVAVAPTKVAVPATKVVGATTQVARCRDPKVGRVTPCAPSNAMRQTNGARGATRPTPRYLAGAGFAGLAWDMAPRIWCRSLTSGWSLVNAPSALPMLALASE